MITGRGKLHLVGGKRRGAMVVRVEVSWRPLPMPCVRSPAALPLTADVLREHDPDPRRLLFWLKGSGEGRFQHWQRIAADARAEVAVGEGVSAAPARVTAFRQELAGKVRRLLHWSWNGDRPGGTRFVLPTGEWAEPVGPPRED